MVFGDHTLKRREILTLFGWLPCTLAFSDGGVAADRRIVDTCDNAAERQLRTTVFGVGGAGNNVVLHQQNRDGLEFVAVNTDAQLLNLAGAPQKLLLGPSGLGAGACVEAGAQAAEESRFEIAAAMRGAGQLLIVAGMGGGTGTGASPVIAQIASELGIRTKAVVSMPFAFESDLRKRNALLGLERLSRTVESLIVLNSDAITVELSEETEISTFFRTMDRAFMEQVELAAM